MWRYKDDIVREIENIVKPPPEPVTPSAGGVANTPSAPVKEVIKAIHRQVIFPAKTLKTEEEIDAYVEDVRSEMKNLLKDCNGIKLN
jgi:hypothetical protein